MHFRVRGSGLTSTYAHISCALKYKICIFCISRCLHKGTVLLVPWPAFRDESRIFESLIFRARGRSVAVLGLISATVLAAFELGYVPDGSI